MIRNRGILYCMTAIFLIFAIYLCVNPAQTEVISFLISSDENDQSVSLWENEAGQHYVFLPSYAKMEHVRIALHTSNPVSINGVTLENGMGCTSFEEGIVYPFSYTVWGRIKKEKIIFLRSANVAALYIDTQSGSMDYIHDEKGNKESGTLTIYLPDGTTEYSGEITSIQGRGNYTWGGFEKKPYSINLAETADLLNLGSAQRWVLLANACDPSHMRNKVIYDFADRVGLKYAPGSDWVDLYLNGDYVGLYLLSERNEVHQERVNIAETGSFLVSMEHPDRLAAQRQLYVSTAADQYLRVHYPKNPSSSQLQELEDIWQSVENAILAEDDTDPVTGKTWMEQIDLDSWVKKYLLEEIFGNMDACFISQFFYCDGNDETGKIYAGPVWDYDIAMGTESFWQQISPNTLSANRYDVNDGLYAPWFHTLYQKEIFYKRMIELYQSDFLPLLNGFLYEHMTACSKWIVQAAEMNQARWNLGEVDIWKQAEYLKNYMTERILFLNNIWIDQLPYCVVKVDDAFSGFNYGHYAVFSGEILNDLPVFESTETRKFLGWYDSETGEPFCTSDPIYEDIAIRAKWQMKESTSLGEIARRMSLLVLLILFLLFAGIDFYRGSLRRSKNRI